MLIWNAIFVPEPTDRLLSWFSKIKVIHVEKFILHRQIAGAICFLDVGTQ